MALVQAFYIVYKYTLWHIPFQINLYTAYDNQLVIAYNEEVKTTIREVKIRKKKLLGIDKDKNPEILLVYCGIHWEILMSQKFLSVLNAILKSIIKCCQI